MQQFCWDQGGYLVEITSAEEEALLDSLYGFGHIYWIGLSDLDVEGMNEDHVYLNCTDPPRSVCLG